MDSGVCRKKATGILKALGFSNLVTSLHGDYVYGNYVGNRAAVKCVPLDEGTFLYASVAGPDVKEVERLRNEIMWQY
jgi:rhodanese-related sulfurtransferase